MEFEEGQQISAAPVRRCSLMPFVLGLLPSEIFQWINFQTVIEINPLFLIKFCRPQKMQNSK